MSDTQIVQLQESQQELVGYVQDYQQRLVEADFATVQANGRAAKAERRAAQLEEQLNEATRSLAELKPAEKEADPDTLVEDVAAATKAPEEPAEPTKRTPRGK